MSKNVVYVNITEYSSAVKHAILKEILNRACLKGYGLEGAYCVGNAIGMNKKTKIIICFSNDYTLPKKHNALSVDDAINGDY